MKSVAFALLLIAGCLPDVDQFPITTSSNGPIVGQSREGTNTRPDAAATPADGGIGEDGRIGFDALPTAFDAGVPFDVGSPPMDVLFH